MQTDSIISGVGLSSRPQSATRLRCFFSFLFFTLKHKLGAFLQWLECFCWKALENLKYLPFFLYSCLKTCRSELIKKNINYERLNDSPLTLLHFTHCLNQPPIYLLYSSHTSHFLAFCNLIRWGSDYLPNTPLLSPAV